MFVDVRLFGGEKGLVDQSALVHDGTRNRRNIVNVSPRFWRGGETNA